MTRKIGPDDGRTPQAQRRLDFRDVTTGIELLLDPMVHRGDYSVYLASNGKFTVVVEKYTARGLGLPAKLESSDPCDLFMQVAKHLCDAVRADAGLKRLAKPPMVQMLLKAYSTIARALGGRSFCITRDGDDYVVICGPAVAKMLGVQRFSDSDLSALVDAVTSPREKPSDPRRNAHHLFESRRAQLSAS